MPKRALSRFHFHMLFALPLVLGLGGNIGLSVAMIEDYGISDVLPLLVHDAQKSHEKAEHFVRVSAPIVLLTSAGALSYFAFFVTAKVYEHLGKPRHATIRLD